MSRNRWLAIAAVVALLALVAVVIFLRRPKAEDAAADVEPTAAVTVASVQGGQLQDVVSVYGVVQADPSGVFTVAAPRAAVVRAIMVRSGQAVVAGQAIADIANAPASELAYRQAAEAVTFATADLARVKRLYDERLAASDQLNAANKVLADARSMLAAQQQQGAGLSRQTLRAPQAAVVTAVSVSPGDRLAQDAPLVVLARAGAVTVKLGLEPTSARVTAGQMVILRPVAGGQAVNSRITMVGRAADQSTKVLDATAPLNGAAWPIGASVQGDIVTGGHSGLLVPRASVVFDETGPHLFTITGGKAHRLFVAVGQDHGDNIEVTGAALAAGATVAVEGAYELQDGMAVKVRGK